MKVVAFPRTEQGSGASRRLRNAGQTPGIIYGGTEAPVAISLDHNALYHALKKEAFNLRFQQATGQMESTARMRAVRRDVARVKTILNQKAADAAAAN